MRSINCDPQVVGRARPHLTSIMSDSAGAGGEGPAAGKTHVLLLLCQELVSNGPGKYRTVSCISHTFLPPNQVSKEGVRLIHEYVQVLRYNRRNDSLVE